MRNPGKKPKISNMEFNNSLRTKKPLDNVGSTLLKLHKHMVKTSINLKVKLARHGLGISTTSSDKCPLLMLSQPSTMESIFNSRSSAPPTENKLKYACFKLFEI